MNTGVVVGDGWGGVALFHEYSKRATEQQASRHRVWEGTESVTERLMLSPLLQSSSSTLIPPQPYNKAAAF